MELPHSGAINHARARVKALAAVSEDPAHSLGGAVKRRELRRQLRLGNLLGLVGELNLALGSGLLRLLEEHALVVAHDVDALYERVRGVGVAERAVEFAQRLRRQDALQADTKSAAIASDTAV